MYSRSLRVRLNFVVTLATFVVKPICFVICFSNLFALGLLYKVRVLINAINMGCWVTRETKNPNVNHGSYRRKQVPAPITKPITPLRAKSVTNATTGRR